MNSTTTGLQLHNDRGLQTALEDSLVGTRTNDEVAPIAAVRQRTPRTAEVRLESRVPACALGDRYCVLDAARSRCRVVLGFRAVVAA